MAVRVDNENVNTDDITDQYYDLDARLTTLQATEEQLLSLLEETRARGYHPRGCYEANPALREIIPSYAYQIKKAVLRSDLVSINHRLAALLASYFDILFALNRKLHPGEKRLVEYAQNRCSKLPENMVEDIQRLLAAGATGDPISQIHMDKLLDSLDSILMSEGFA